MSWKDELRAALDEWWSEVSHTQRIDLDIDGPDVILDAFAAAHPYIEDFTDECAYGCKLIDTRTAARQWSVSARVEWHVCDECAKRTPGENWRLHLERCKP